MRVRMQKLNMVKYADSEARVKDLEKQGYKKSPVQKGKPDKKDPAGKAADETGGTDG